jgi:outer membrane cobalamin receptor
VSSLFMRGGYDSDSLVEIDGVPVNAFGGSFDFAHIPAEALDRIEVIRGPQSAVYGPYANSGAINFITRQADSPPGTRRPGGGRINWRAPLRHYRHGRRGGFRDCGLGFAYRYERSRSPTATITTRTRC